MTAKLAFKVTNHKSSNLFLSPTIAAVLRFGGRYLKAVAKARTVTGTGKIKYNDLVLQMTTGNYDLIQNGLYMT